MTCGSWFLLAALCTGMRNSHQGRKCGNLRNHATMPSRSLFHHTCLVARVSSSSASQLKNNAKLTAHQPQRRQRHQRNKGASSVSGTNGAICNTESDIESPRSSGGTAAASSMTSELEDMCAVYTTCARKNPQRRNQNWRGVSCGRALFCGTCFALCTCRASGVLCRGICMRYITLAICVTLPYSCGVRNTRCTPTKRKPEMHVLAKRCKEMYRGPRKTKLTTVF